MRYKELPSALQLRLLTFYHYRNKIGFERNQKIIQEVSPYLREVHFINFSYNYNRKCNYLKLLASLIYNYMKYKKLVIFYVKIDSKTLLYVLIMKIFFLGNHFA